MKQTSTELKVGIFAIVVIIFLSYMTFKVGGLPFIWEKGYRLSVEFDDISGLDEQSRVRIAGVEAGIVEKIRLENGKAKVTLLMSPDIRIYSDAKAALKMSGLLGDRFLAVSTGSPDKPLLKNGDTILITEHAADIDSLANQLTSAANEIGELTRNIRDIFGEQEREALRSSIRDLQYVTKNLREISTENRAPLHNIIAQLDEFTRALGSKGPEFISDLSSVAKALGEKGPALIENLNEAAVELKDVIKENRYALKDSVQNIRDISRSTSVIAGKLEKGEGTLGKLMKDDTLYNSLTKVSTEAGKSLDVVNRLRTYLDFHTEYNTGESGWKGFFDLTLKPRDDKYYIIGVVTDPRGSVETTDTTINGVTFTEEETKSRIEFSAQFAKRIEDFALRIGLTESTFGAGADYFFHDDRGRVKIDVWDLGADESEADRAHAKVGIDYTLFKYLFVSAGVDNILNENRRGIYVGGGLQFEDEDFKYLFGTSPKLSLP